MKYYLRNAGQHSITGPFELDEIDAKLQAGELSAGTLATRDIGEDLAGILHTPPEDWLPVESICGLVVERQPSAEALPPGPPPAPPQSLMNAPSSTSSGMAFCPACGHKLAPDAGSVCDRCGKELFVPRPEPIKLIVSKPKPLLTTVASGAAKAALGIGGCLVLVLLILGGILLFGLLFLLHFMPTCKA